MIRKEADAREEGFQRLRPGSGVENRRHYRHPVHWRVAIVHKNGDKNDIYHGRTHDLSAWGASVLLNHNIFVMADVVVLLAIPPNNPGQKEIIIEIDSRMAYTVLDSDQQLFRIGIRFLKFKGEGKRILADVLSKRAIPKPENKRFGMK